MTTDADLAAQIDYYRAVAREYHDHPIDPTGQTELLAAVEGFRPTGDVLELTCGTGVWTKHLVQSAASVTSVDAAPEMLRLAREHVGDAPVRFIEADLFTWRPDRRYDAVFFGFWLSHVPDDRFADFWSMVADALEPAGEVFFVDDNFRGEEELIEGPDSMIVERRLNDGSAHRAIKVPHDAPVLEARLRALGWKIDVTATAGAFYWGRGTR